MSFFAMESILHALFKMTRHVRKLLGFLNKNPTSCSEAGIRIDLKASSRAISRAPIEVLDVKDSKLYIYLLSTPLKKFKTTSA